MYDQLERKETETEQKSEIKIQANTIGHLPTQFLTKQKLLLLVFLCKFGCDSLSPHVGSLSSSQLDGSFCVAHHQSYCRGETTALAFVGRMSSSTGMVVGGEHTGLGLWLEEGSK